MYYVVSVAMTTQVELRRERVVRSPWLLLITSAATGPIRKFGKHKPSCLVGSRADDPLCDWYLGGLAEQAMPRRVGRVERVPG